MVAVIGWYVNHDNFSTDIPILFKLYWNVKLNNSHFLGISYSSLSSSVSWQSSTGSSYQVFQPSSRWHPAVRLSQFALTQLEDKQI